MINKNIKSIDTYSKIKHIYSPDDWEYIKPIVDEINELKKEKNAFILAHNYMTPDIYHCVSDFVGDSLALAIEGQKTDADIIVMAGVHFMAETSKILSPEKKVLIPDETAGCSLASSITGADVRMLKQKYPGRPVITYVNTTADVKAETDICCTSGNVEKIVKSLGVDEIILIPDKYLAGNVEKQTGIKCITWDDGACEVHELFTVDEMKSLRKGDPNLTIIAHPECPKEVVAEADFAGSTAGMINYVIDNQPAKVALITECSMSQNIAKQSPNTEFVGMCRMCPHMKKITLENILKCLKKETVEVTLDDETIKKAHGAVQRMLDVS
ncbi:MAG: quinolinate synthase NadA [Alphaproteobacteria bacterium]